MDLTDSLTSADCCIVGAGPGSLLLALLLARQHLRIILLEQQKDFVPARGGVVLQPGILKLFEHVGILAHLEKEAHRLDGLEEYGPGGLIFQQAYGDICGTPFPYALAVNLAKLRQVLLEQVQQEPSVSLVLGAGVDGLEVDGEGRYQVVVLSDGQRRIVQASVIVGGDGKFSTVRHLAGFPTQILDFATQHIVLRLPCPENWSSTIKNYHDQAHFLLTVPVWENDLFVFWKLKHGELDEYKQSAVEKLTEQIADVEPALRESLATVHRWDQVISPVYHTVQVETWHRRNLVLLGDSAHSMHPLGGQGLNMTFQDAVWLAQVIEQTLHTANLDELGTFAQLRKPFVEQFQQRQRVVLQRSPDQSILDETRSLYAEYFADMVLGQPEIRSLYMN